MLSSAELQVIVRKHISDLLQEAGVEGEEITGAEHLNAIGLNSLLLARLIIELETETGVDPFGTGDLVISDVQTVAQLADAYLAAPAASAAV